MNKKLIIIVFLLSVNFRLYSQEIFRTIQNGNTEKFQELLNSSDSVIHSTDISGNTPIHLAAYFNRVEFLKSLLNHGADIQAHNNAGRNALVFAIAGNGLESAKMLMDEGIDLHAEDHSGRTPLHWCGVQGKKEMVSLLIKHGANVHALDEQLRTPLHLAASSGNAEVAKAFITHGALVNVVDYHARTPLFSASWSGHLDVVKLLIANQALVDARYIGAASPLTTASVADNTEVCKYLVSQHADVNLVCNMLVTPIYPAIVNNNQELVDFYLEHQAQVNYRDLAGRTPLYVAVRDGYTEIVKSLLKHDADPHILDEASGRTLLHLAASHGRMEIFDLLLAEGVSLNAKDNQGYTALDYAQKHGFKTLAETIKLRGGKSNISPKVLNVKDICQKVKHEEAFITKLRNNTWSINTQSGMFVLGYEEGGVIPEEASLVNGILKPEELKNIPIYHFDGAFSSDAVLFKKQQDFKNLSFLCNAHYENRYKREEYFNGKTMFFPEDYKPITVKDAKVTALPGFRPYHKSYLIQSGGLNILWLYWQSDRYNPREKNVAPIKYLKEKGISIDLLFVGVPYADMGPEWISVMEEEYKMAKELSVQAIFPVPSCKMGEYFYNERKRKGDESKIWFATNPGDVFHYKEKNVSKL